MVYKESFRTAGAFIQRNSVLYSKEKRKKVYSQGLKYEEVGVLAVEKLEMPGLLQGAKGELCSQGLGYKALGHAEEEMTQAGS